MSLELSPKVLVIGGGPGGYVAAIRCGQLGLETVLVEADRLGGTCLIRGCIPSKALIHAAGKFAHMAQAAQNPMDGIRLTAPPQVDFKNTLAWKDGIVDTLHGGVSGLLKRAKVKVIHGWGHFSDAKTCHVEAEDGEVVIQPEHVILAAGSTPAALPNLPFDGRVISSNEALSLEEVPEKLTIVGAGYIGIELGSAFAKLGAEVHVVEAASRILPQYDPKLAAPVKRAMEANGVVFHLQTQALEMREEGLAISGPNTDIIPAEKVLVTVGRKPRTAGWGLESMALKMDGVFVRVDDQCATSSHNVWAIGDLVGEPMLAHKASAQGEMVAEIIAGRRRRFDPAAIPAVCFSDPEILSVGAGPDAPDIIAGTFPLAANGRALTMGDGAHGGFVRVIADKDTHRVVGVQAVGAHISELSAAFTQAIEMNAVLEAVAGIIHAHPTLGEGFHEACLDALGHAIHI